MIKDIFRHRSVRKYYDWPIDEGSIYKILSAGIRASTTGNMQLYSVIITTDREKKAELAPLHFNQPMVTQAPVLLTFCADIHRFEMWCQQRGANPQFDNFLWFVNALTDTVLVAQNVALAAESLSMGICFLGTTVYNADKIVEVMELPRGVIPVTAMTVGYHDGTTPLTDRLPLEAVIHKEGYNDYPPDDIDRYWRRKENSAQTRALLEENNLPSLASIFTERRYPAEDNLNFSRSYFEVLKRQGFFNQ